MSLKTTSLKLGLALSLLSGGQSLNGMENKEASSQHGFPKIVAAEFHKEIQQLLVPDTCNPTHVDIVYDDEFGEQYLQKVSNEDILVEGTITGVNIQCSNGEKNTHGDLTMPVSSSETLGITSSTGDTLQLQQRAKSYTFQHFPGVQLQLDAHHSSVPFQKLMSIERALQSIQDWGLHSPLTKISIRALDTPNAFSEVPSKSNGGLVDEIVLSKQMLEEYSVDELSIILRHEILHLIAESGLNPAWDETLKKVSSVIQTMSDSSQRTLSRRTNETYLYPTVFSKAHRANPHNMEELPIMFFNTHHEELLSKTDTPEEYTKAALAKLMQLSKE